MTNFDRLNKETFNYNNGISRNISPTSPANCKMRASDLLSNYNNYTYKQHNGAYSDRLYK